MTHDPLARFRNDLLAIADTYALLAAKHHAAATGNPGVRVGGSTEPKLPIAVDEVDLTGEARRASLNVIETTPWPEDQIGHQAIATELDRHVFDIAAFLGDKRPVPTVPLLASWLHERAGWALDYYHGFDSMAVNVGKIARTLHAMVNPGRSRAEQKAAPCPGCGEATLQGDGERVWCIDDEVCGRILTEGEYSEWSRSVIVRETLGGEGMTAAAIAIKYGRSKESVHWLAHKHGWTRSSGKQRPVMYRVDDVTTTMTTIHDRATRRAARLDTA